MHAILDKSQRAGNKFEDLDFQEQLGVATTLTFKAYIAFLKKLFYKTFHIKPICALDYQCLHANT
jgi:hypothetical protein